MLRTAFLVLALFAVRLAAADPAFKAGDRIAICGDSITEQKLYSRFMEAYLLASSGVADLDVAQFGWSGEVAGGFAARCARSLEWFKPMVATTVYGMNDGRYQAFTDDIGRGYREAMGKALDELKAVGVREVVVSTPGVVDTTAFKRPCGPEVYNDSLARLGGIGKELAGQRGLRFADTHGAMISAMAKAKAALGDAYDVAGGDGVHPNQNGHLLMAGSLLAGLGCDGAIARIEFAGGKATASAGHTVTAAADGSVELDSARWPFVLTGDAKSSGGTRSIAPFTDFIERLDRFTVIMPDCAWDKATITWGAKSVAVDGAALRQGVNLMALFDATPFDQAADKLNKAIAVQQDFETNLVKGLLNGGFRKGIDADPESKELFTKLLARQIALRADFIAAVRATLVPVHHRIAVAKAEGVEKAK